MEQKKRRAGNKILLGVGIGFAVIFGLIVSLPIIMLVLLFVYIAQVEAADAAPDQIKVINQSSTVIQSIEVDGTGILGQPLRLGDDISVEWETWPAALTVYGENGILGQRELPKAPNQVDTKDCWYIIVQDGPEGLIFTCSHLEKLEKRISSMGDRVGLDLSDGIVVLYDAPGRGIQGDGHDFMILQFGREEAAALEAQLAAGKGWHPYEEQDLLEDIFFGESSTCKGRVYEVPRPTEGWYFYRDTYNSQHGDNDENQWSVEYRGHLPNNYTAAIYDSATRTLYIWDYDS